MSETTEDTKSAMRDAIFKVFINFAKYSSSEKNFFISTRLIQKLYSRLNAPNKKKIKPAELDIMVKNRSKSSNELNFDQFIDLMAEICFKLNKNKFEEDPQNTLVGFVKTNFDFSSDQNTTLISENSGNNVLLQSSLDRCAITSEATDYFTNRKAAFRVIYESYFPMEVALDETMDRVEENSSTQLLTLLHDFEVIPYTLSVKQAVITWLHCMSIEDGAVDQNGVLFCKGAENEGKVFTLEKFMLFLYFTCQFKFVKISSYGSELSEFEKFLVFFEKMESSKGFRNLNRKRNKPQLEHMRLLPPREEIIANKPDFVRHHAKSQSDFFNSSGFNKSSLFKTFASGECENDREVFSEHHQMIKTIFRHYSVFGDKSKPNSMKFNSFRIFCDAAGLMDYEKEAKVEQKLSINDLSPIFIESARKKGEKLNQSLFQETKQTRGFALDFKGFLNSIEGIGRISYPSMEGSEPTRAVVENVLK